MSRPTPRPLTVIETSYLAKRARRIVFEGDLIEESRRPAAYLSIWFTDPDSPASLRTGRSDKRTMTVRFWERSTSRLTVDFVLHGSGPASSWAATAEPGDVVWGGPTKGGYEVPPAGSFLVMAGDDTATPAVGAIAEALPPDTKTCVILEVVDEADEREISPQRSVDAIWLHRGPDPAESGRSSLRLIEELEVPDDAYWWLAGERTAVLAMRDLLVEDRGVPRTRYDINAHWRLDATDPRNR